MATAPETSTDAKMAAKPSVSYTVEISLHDVLKLIKLP